MSSNNVRDKIKIRRKLNQLIIERFSNFIDGSGPVNLCTEDKDKLFMNTNTYDDSDNFSAAAKEAKIQCNKCELKLTMKNDMAFFIP